MQGITVLRNALYEPDMNATNLVMVVNDCKVATDSTLDPNGNLTQYAGSTACIADDQQRYDYTTNITV